MTRFLATLALCLVTTQAYAVPGVSGLYNTGVGNTGTALPIGTTDSHWDLSYVGVPAGLPALAMTPHPAWVDHSTLTPDARWIGPVDSANEDPQFPGTVFSYTLEFNIDPIVNLSLLGVEGSWASDNESQIWLNGAYTGISRPAGSFENNDGSYVDLLDFIVTSGFQYGTNTLTFIVPNDSIPGGPPGFLNPTGLLVADLASVTVPEPSSIVLCGLAGVATVGVYLRRKMQRA